MYRTKVVSNYNWRQFCYRDEVPADVLASEFDYQDPEETTDGFFCYRGIWYHIDQFERRGIGVGKWQGAHCDSFFSGVVICISDDGESYQIGSVYSTSDNN